MEAYFGPGDGLKVLVAVGDDEEKEEPLLGDLT